MKIPHILNDQTAKKDDLGFDEYVQTLEEFITHSDTETPLSIGILGRWGTGKSTLMEMLKKKLNASKLTTVWFNAWRYSKEDELWAAFLQSIFNQIQAELSPWNKLVFQSKLFYRRISWRDIPKLLVQYVIRAIIVLIPLLIIDPIFKQITPGLQPYLQTGKIIMVVALAIWIVLKPFTKEIQDKINLDLGAFLKSSNYKDHIAFLDKFREHFSSVVLSLPPKNGKRLAIFIDDLDRCTSEQTLQVLDALKVFIDVEGCIYILGIDIEIVQRAVAAKYKGDSLAQREFLGKIIQLPFQLPPLTPHKMRRFIKNIAIGLPNDRCYDVFIAALIANPREIKRTINIFSLLWHLTNQNDKSKSITPVRLAKVVVIQNSHPSLHTILRKRPILLKELEQFFRHKHSKGFEQEKIKATPSNLTSQPEDPNIGKQQRTYLNELRRQITDKLDSAELQNLCFDLGVDYDSLPGDEKPSKARELVSQLERQNRINDLVETGKLLRSDILWDEEDILLADEIRLSPILKPFVQSETLYNMFTLYSPKQKNEDDENFEHLNINEIEVYFTLTNQVEVQTLDYPKPQQPQQTSASDGEPGHP